MTNTEKIREACIKANSGILVKECPCNGWKYQKRTECNECKGNKGLIPREIRLADVLLAIFAKEKVQAEQGEWKDNYHHTRMDLLAIWNLKETMENQLEETKAFIAGLL